MPPPTLPPQVGRVVLVPSAPESPLRHTLTLLPCNWLLLSLLLFFCPLASWGHSLNTPLLTPTPLHSLRAHCSCCCCC